MKIRTSTPDLERKSCSFDTKSFRVLRRALVPWSLTFAMMNWGYCRFKTCFVSVGSTPSNFSSLVRSHEGLVVTDAFHGLHVKDVTCAIRQARSPQARVESAHTGRICIKWTHQVESTQQSYGVTLFRHGPICFRTTLPIHMCCVSNHLSPDRRLCAQQAYIRCILCARRWLHYF